MGATPAAAADQARPDAADPRAPFDMSDGLQQCIRCGMCLEACPTYGITGLETESPRGRIHLMQALFEGRIAPEPETRVHLDRCLGCRACEAVCPSGVRYGALLEHTRADLARHEPPSALAALLLWIVARPRALAIAAAIASVPERLGLRALVRRAAARRLLPKGLLRLESLAPSLVRPRYRPPRRPATPVSRGALLLGCVMRVAYGDVHTAAARLLARSGVEVVDVPRQVCCGALHAHAGARDQARSLARRNIAAFEHADLDTVVVDAAGCGAHLKDYPELLGDDAEWRERAIALAAKVRDLTEVLPPAAPPSPRSLAPDAAADGTAHFRVRVTYQDPCHLAHAQRIHREPRALLSGVPGLELVELRGADVCCGSAGYYNLTQPEYADRLLRDKVAAILETGADAVVTANPGCMLQIEAGLRAAGSAMPVLHIAEVLDRAGAGGELIRPPADRQADRPPRRDPLAHRSP